MKPLRLYIENFQCHSNSFIDFTQFNSALVVGKIDNNELYSNGVGKTTIFKAIEYVLFNQADVNLEKIIRDDTPQCKIVFDFIIGSQEYRVSRMRTRKDSTDLSLWQRNTKKDINDEAYHLIDNDGNYIPVDDKNDLKKYWKDISGRRAADTEKELAKLIKTNFRSFRSTVHFLQNDFGGLCTATPEKRKAILKEALLLVVYSKLEKLAKEKSSTISKDIEKHKTLIDSLGDPDKELLDLDKQLVAEEIVAKRYSSELSDLNSNLETQTSVLNELLLAHSVLENKFAELLNKEKSLILDKSKLESSIKEYSTKKSNIVKSARILSEELNGLKETQLKLVELDYSQIDILSEEIKYISDQITCHNLTIKNTTDKYNDLGLPVPDDKICKHCRQEMTEEHRITCRTQIAKEMDDCKILIDKLKGDINKLNSELVLHKQTVNSLMLSRQQLESINTQITNKNKELSDKRAIHDEYQALLTKFNSEFTDKSNELLSVQNELSNSALNDDKKIQEDIIKQKQCVNDVSSRIATLNKAIAQNTSDIAVFKHLIDQKKNEQVKKSELVKQRNKLEDSFSIYPLVLQAFSSTGIPNLIIQNVLDDLQIEANNLLSQLKPGLQLSFSIEKTRGDGAQDDTLDINYFINGKSRDYEQLSGAMKLAVTFSLKLGLSFLLQKMIGTDIRFLLLDEIDPSLDKASVDAFSDIVKFFQKDFTILVITHNDRLKDKFSHAILVEQDINMVSKARVVSSW